jgi:hypothetical protein
MPPVISPISEAPHEPIDSEQNCHGNRANYNCDESRMNRFVIPPPIGISPNPSRSTITSVASELRFQFAGMREHQCVVAGGQMAVWRMPRIDSYF